MQKTHPITEAFLLEKGFYKDQTAPEGVNRYNNHYNGYKSHFISVTFTGETATYIFIRMTNYNLTGAVIKTKTWNVKGNALTREDLERGMKETEIVL